MQTILFFTDLHAGAHQIELTGVYERARELGWRVIEIEYARTSRPAEDFIGHWNPVGVIVECGHLRVPVNYPAYASVPAVFIDPDDRLLASDKPVFAVRHDAVAPAKLAFKELSALNPASYAYVGWCGKMSWSEGRRRAFGAMLREAGIHKLHTFTEVWFRNDLVAFQRELATWLATLPKPCGIFAANDETAEQVAVSCQQLGLECPGDVAIIGVDNDTLRCENSSPTISSIEADFLGAGRMAVDLLAKRLADPSAPPEIRTFGPLRLIRRESTRKLDSADRHIRRAVERIRRDACAGLAPAQVLADIPYSRRLAEQRFRAATGRSIGEEIAEVRFEQVLRFLRDPTRPISLIAKDCGWDTDSFLKRAFRKRTGLTMRAWRRRELDAPTPGARPKTTGGS